MKWCLKQTPMTTIFVNLFWMSFRRLDTFRLNIMILQFSFRISQRPWNFLRNSQYWFLYRKSVPKHITGISQKKLSLNPPLPDFFHSLLLFNLTLSNNLMYCPTIWIILNGNDTGKQLNMQLPIRLGSWPINSTIIMILLRLL